MATSQQIETKLRAPRCLNNIPFSARAQCPGMGTKSGRSPSLDAALDFNLYQTCSFIFYRHFSLDVSPISTIRARIYDKLIKSLCMYCNKLVIN